LIFKSLSSTVTFLKGYSNYLTTSYKHSYQKQNEVKEVIYHKAKTSQAPEDWEAYRSIKNEITSDIRRSYTNIQQRPCIQKLLEIYKEPAKRLGWS